MPRNVLKLPESYDAASEITSPEDSYSKYKLAFTAVEQARANFHSADSEYFAGENAQQIRKFKSTPQPRGLLGRAARREIKRKLEEAYSADGELDSARAAANMTYGDFLGHLRVAEEAGELHFTQNEAAYYQDALETTHVKGDKNPTPQSEPTTPFEQK